MVSFFRLNSFDTKRSLPLFLACCSCLILLSSAAFSQNIGSQDNLNRISANPGIVQTYDSRYEGVKGTPNVFANFMTGSITLNNDAVYKNLLLNIDGYKNAILYRTCSNCEIKILDKTKVRSFDIIDQEIERKFVVEPGADKGVEVREILVQGKSSYYRTYKVALLKADYQGAYSGNRKYDSFEMTAKYFVAKEGAATEVKLKPKQLKQTFPEKADLISDYLKSIKSDLSSDNNIKELFKLIDQ
jgi:hypothetical protein